MLRAAQIVFAEKGYARATLDEIAERAEFGKGTLYNYFEGGKEDILFAIFESIYDDICEIIRRVFLEESPPDRPLRETFHAFVKAFIDFAHEREELFLILAKESHRMAFSEDADRACFFQKQQDRMVDTLTPILERAMEADEIQDLPSEPVAHLLIANVNGMVIHHHLSKHDDPNAPSLDLCDTSTDHDAPLLDRPDEAADFLTRMLFDGLGRT